MVRAAALGFLAGAAFVVAAALGVILMAEADRAWSE
jgi:hypothetical protein